jgi:crossover junction endodeoxyribonuclease RusA
MTARGQQPLTRSVTFDLPFPPSFNLYYRTAARGGRGGRAFASTYISAKGLAYADDVAAAVWDRFGKISPIDFRLRIGFILHPPDLRKRDLDNYQKAPLDALTKCGFWKDDELIDDLRTVRGEIIRPKGKLVVTVEEIEAAGVLF